MNLMVTTNQKPTIDTQKLKRKYTEILLEKNHQIKGKKQKEKEQKRTIKTNRNQVRKWQ